jgi:hypothetical protein
MIAALAPYVMAAAIGIALASLAHDARRFPIIWRQVRAAIERL